MVVVILIPVAWPYALLTLPLVERGCWSLRRLCHRSVSHTLSKEKSRMELNDEHIRALANSDTARILC